MIPVAIVAVGVALMAWLRWRPAQPPRYRNPKGHQDL